VRTRRPAAPRPAPLAAALTLALVLAVAGCTGGDGEPEEPLPPGTLRVLAGSELRDVQPLLGKLRQATGVNLKLDYAGTLEGAERLASGERYDLAWFSSARYLSLLSAKDGKGRPVASERTMLSPVVLGVKQSVAARFGWGGGKAVTWADIAARAKAGELRYGMTNPAASNSGFSALVGVATAFAGTGEALTAKDINARRLTEFFSGQALTAGSSGWLADAYVRDQERLDGLINYESVLLGLNAGGKLSEPLQLIYPREGIATADYPLLLMDQAKRAQYDKVVAWLRGPQVQRELMTATSRRPAVPGVALDRRFPTATLIELPFPSSLSVVDELLAAYLDRFRKPARTIYVLDHSGSMEGERIDSLRQSFANLTGADTSVSGRFARFRDREKVTIITFAENPLAERDFTIDARAGTSASLAAVREYVNDQQLANGTGIWSALDQAYRRVQADAAADQGFYTSIVLMTDGENNAGISVDEFLQHYHGLPEQARSVKTFAIRFGEADPEELRRVAQETGGQVFDANAGSLTAAFKEIRGYQ
jgi:Ca-activated chloride channel family protein